MEFRALASSSAGCCYHVTSGERPPLLIDAGIKFQDIQKGTGFRVSGLAGALISHYHGDHSVAARKLADSAVDLYASAETFSALGLETHHRSHGMAPRVPVEFAGWSVLPFEAVHDAPGTFGFVVGDGYGHRLLYLTDSAYSLFKFEGLTHIAVECNYSKEIMRANTASGSIGKERFRRTSTTHMSLDRLVAMLKANDLSKVEEIHLLHLSDENSNEDEFAAEIRRATGRAVYVAPKFRSQL